MNSTKKAPEVMGGLQALDLPPAASRLGVGTQGEHIGRKQELATGGIAKRSQGIRLVSYTMGPKPTRLFSILLEEDEHWDRVITCTHVHPDHF